MRVGLAVEFTNIDVTAIDELADVRQVPIENLDGDLVVGRGPEGHVRIEGKKFVRALRIGDAARADQHSALGITRPGISMVIALVRKENTTGVLSISTNLRIEMPKDVSIEARGRWGKFEVGGVNGPISLNGMLATCWNSGKSCTV